MIVIGRSVPFYLLEDGIPLNKLGDCWANQTFFKFDVFQTPSETERLIASETDTPLLTVFSCTFCTGYNYVIIFLLFYGVTLGTWVGVSMGASSTSGVNQVSLRSTFSCATQLIKCCTRECWPQGIVPSLMNETVEIHHQTPHKIELLGLGPYLLILHEMVSVQDIYLQMSRVPT